MFYRIEKDRVEETSAENWESGQMCIRDRECMEDASFPWQIRLQESRRQPMDTW